MATTDKENQEYLETAKRLVKALESGVTEEANQLIDELSSQKNAGLFQEIGKLTRDLHEALNNFRVDSRITELAEKDIPDAKERLIYVISKTEEAADRTLTAMENSIPLCDEMSKRSNELKDEWARFTKREMEPGEFRELSKDVNAFLVYMASEAGNVKNNLNDAIMAQDYQDLTGQIIKKVITLVGDVEDNLINLIKVAGPHMMAHEGIISKDKSGVSGPVVPGIDDKKGSDTVSGQDEVDDLLSSFGF